MPPKSTKYMRCPRCGKKGFHRMRGHSIPVYVIRCRYCGHTERH